MPLDIDITVHPDQIDDQIAINNKVLKKARLDPSVVGHLVMIRRSIDARKLPNYRLRFRIYKKGEVPPAIHRWMDQYQQVKESDEVVIIGAGPAGYFAALECLELGLKPIVVDRGKDVQRRRRDLRSIQQESKVNPDSNYCFGEGGAGTYSDGKLYTRSKKRGDVRKVLQILVEHGAVPEILVEAHPHIGSNKLPKIIQKIRQTILKFGGEVHFNAKVEDLLIQAGRLTGLRFSSGACMKASKVILATGHSARDIYQILRRHALAMLPKPFAVGVRIEHPQLLIDQIQYRQNPRHQNLPAAAYRLASTFGEHGVFSFCMCPGGMVVPASTDEGELVVNGMSLSRRDSPYANAGLVVTVGPEDWSSMGFDPIFGGLEMQIELEKRFFSAGDGSLAAPAQRVSDFLLGTKSKTLPSSSYIPGLLSVAISNLLPTFIYENLCRGLLEFDKKLPGFVTSDAVVIGLESRTSAPLRIPRSDISLEHPEVRGLFPCGEGAGYAGGIVSAAIDGQMVARAVATQLGKA